MTTTTMMTNPQARTTVANEKPQSIVSSGSNTKPPTGRKDGNPSGTKQGSSNGRYHDHDHDHDPDTATATTLPLQVIVLVVDPLADHHESRSAFELLQVQVLYGATTTTTVGDILNQIQRLVHPTMQAQTHKGVLLLLPQPPQPPPSPPPIKNKQQQEAVAAKVGVVLPQPPAALLFSKDVLLQKLVTPLSSLSRNHHQHLRSILLVALPDTVSVSECAQEARTILQDTSVHQLLVRIAQRALCIPWLAMLSIEVKIAPRFHSLSWSWMGCTFLSLTLFRFLFFLFVSLDPIIATHDKHTFISSLRVVLIQEDAIGRARRHRCPPPLLL
jgi:hypothetical protein